MRRIGARFKLRVELGTHEPRMRLHLNYFYQAVVGKRTGDDHPCRSKLIAVRIVKFKAVTMTLVDILFPIGSVCVGSFPQLAGIRPKAHRTAFFHHVHLGIHQRDDRMGCLDIKLGAVRVRQCTDMTGELYDGALHSKTKSQKGDLILPSILNGTNLAFHTAITEAAGH